MSLVLFLLLSIITFHKSMCSNHTVVRCNEKDRETLLTFKQGINDSLGRISTWSTEKDCCAWEGVYCDNITNKVTKLDLQFKQLEGEMNLSILELEFPSYLDLSYNDFDVIRIPVIQHNITHSSKLVYLDLSPLSFDNTLQMDNLHWLSPLSSLKYLDLNGIDLHKETNWLQAVSTLPSLLELHLSYCKLNNFTINESIEYPMNSKISSSGISLVDRHKFSSLIERISNELNLSNNSIAEDISNLTLNCLFLRLDHNNFTGGLPNISPIALLVDLSYNSFSGSIPHSWKNLSELTYIILWSNRLSGEVLVHLSDWKQLQFMNLGENEFSGTIPMNMPEYLEVVILRANQFEGTIPPELFNLSYLFHIDLAHNKLSGSIPKFIYNLNQMVSLYVNSLPSDTTIELFQKGQDYVYEVRPDRRTIDLSANSLSGKVPMELFRLVQVQTLNLSHNNLIGTIPKTIGGMKNMECLDLSNNKLCREIPQSMSDLNFLGYLNLSCNNFNGTIPMGTQLQSFNASSYIGNPELCGTPLKNCTTEEENPKIPKPSIENEDDDSIKESLYLGMGVGFAVAFWGIFGSLLLIRKWRHAYYRFINGVGDKIYVTLMVKLNNFRRNRAPAS